MEILGVGMSELIFIVIIALIVLGPKDMQKAGKTIGKWLRSIVTSDGWKIFQQTSRELRTLPNKLIREANEELHEIGNQVGRDINGTSALNSKGASQKNIPPGSQPYPTQTIPAKPSETIIPPPLVKNKENESGQQNDA